jgi:PAS domain S-box-containing protein
MAGLLVLARWAFNVPALKSIFPEFTAMPPWTAASFIFSAAALAMAASGSPAVRSTSAVPSVALAFTAGAPLGQYAIGYLFGTDVPLFPAAVVAEQAYLYSAPERMSYAAAVGLTALAGALLLAPHAKGPAGRTVFSILATAALAVGMLGLLSYILHLEPLDAMFLHNPLALHSALILAALAIGTLALRTDAGWTRIAIEQGLAGWATVMLFGAGGLLFALGTNAATQTGMVAANAIEASRRLEILLSMLKDAETGQRGYLLTNRTNYLEPYQAAREHLPDVLAAGVAPLVKLKEGPVDLGRLRSLVAEKMAELAETIALHRAGHAAEALAIVEAGNGQAMMDSIRKEVDALVQAVAKDAAELAKLARWIVTIAAIGIIGVATLAFWMLASARRAHKKAAASLATNAARQRDLLATLGLGTFMARSLEGAILYWAEGCERLYGWTAAEASGRSAEDMLGTIYPVPLPEIEAVLQRAGEWKGDLRQQTRDGRTLMVTVHKVLRRGAYGQPDRVLEALIDVTAQRRAETALGESQVLLRSIIETAPGLIYAKDRQGRMLMANSAVTAMVGKPWTELAGRTDRDFLTDPAQGEIVMANDRQVMESGQTQELEELVNEANGQARVWLATKTSMHDADGKVVGLVGVSIEITERKRVEQQLRLMVNELNHRVKNTLVTVQSIASQTLRGVDLAVHQALEGRLQALAAVHDVLTRESWQEAFLQEVIEGVLAPYGGLGNDRFQISGPPIRVQPHGAVAFSLALHELATNAIKYGALSTGLGQVAIRWEAIQTTELHLHMVWSERGGPPVVAPQSRGFGIRLIERCLAQDLGGTAQLTFDTKGITCTIDAVLNEVATAPMIAIPQVDHVGAPHDLYKIVR